MIPSGKWDWKDSKKGPKTSAAHVASPEGGSWFLVVCGPDAEYPFWSWTVDNTHNAVCVECTGIAASRAAAKRASERAARRAEAVQWAVNVATIKRNSL